MQTNSTTTVEETEHEEGKVVDLQRASAENHEARIEAGKAGMRGYLEKFQGHYTTVSDAALVFRENLSISVRECMDVVRALQAMRKETNACLEFLNGDVAIFPPVTTFFNTITSLYVVDGEKTARLILEVELFRSLVTHSHNEDLSRARERITMHVALEERLKSAARDLSKLIGQIEQLLTETPPPIPCVGE